MQATKSLPQAYREGAQKPRSPKGRKFDLREMIRGGEMQAALGSGLLMLAAWAAGTWWSEPLSIALYVVAYAIGGWIKAKEGVETLVRERDLDVNLLMIAAALGAASIGYWNEGAMLIFIFALSGALESYTMERSTKDISALLALKPATALVIENGDMNEVALDDLKVGDLVLVRPGELIPADGVVVRGQSAVDQASITGESVPVDKTAGSEVYTGTVNGEGPLYVEVTQSSENSLFARIVKLVEEAETEVPDSQRFIKKFEAVYARLVVGATVLLIALPPFALDWSWSDTFYKAMVFLVVASPCALVSSIMPAMLSAISKSARRGILFKGGVHLENLAQTAVVAFDKTGTLTEGTPGVTDFAAADGADADELLAACASVEHLSRHPLAEAVVRYAGERGIEPGSAEDSRSLTGWGIEGRFGGRVWRVGKSNVLDEEAAPNLFGGSETGREESEGAAIARQVRLSNAAEELAAWRELRARWEDEGKTVCVVLEEDRVAALLALQDRVRPQAAEAVAALRRMGVRVAMLTGDRERTAETIARRTGVDYCYADLLPEDKVARITELRQRHGHVVMVGDGVNDAPALAAATVGVGMGMKGSGAALEVADVVLMNDSIEEIAATIGLARRSRRIVKQNLAFAITVIVSLIASNFALGIALPFGVVGHEGSTILVILNGLRLLR